MAAVSNSNSQLVASNSESTNDEWDIEATHREINSTCEKIGTYMIDTGDLLAGPGAAAGLNIGLESVKGAIAASFPVASPVANIAIEAAKVPVTLCLQRTAPAVSRACVKMTVPVSKACGHASANASYRSSEWIKDTCSDEK